MVGLHAKIVNMFSYRFCILSHDFGEANLQENWTEHWELPLVVLLGGKRLVISQATNRQAGFIARKSAVYGSSENACRMRSAVTNSFSVGSASRLFLEMLKPAGTSNIESAIVGFQSKLL